MGWAQKTACKPNWCQKKSEDGDGVPGILKYPPLPPEALQRQRPMEQFHDGRHVRLRSRVLGTYLHADHDGEGVSLRRRRASLKQAWTVHLHVGNDGTQYVLLHSAAYGRYLAVTDDPASRGFRVAQRDHDQALAQAIRWQAFVWHLTSMVDIVLCHGAGYNNCCLRANREYLRRNNSVSVVRFHVSTMVQWVVEPIPARQGVPRLPGPSRAGLSAVMLPRAFAAWRTIRFVRASDDGDFTEEGWGTFQFRGRSVYHLRNELATRVGVSNLIMCVRAGPYGRLTPLAGNLPRNGRTIEIVVIIGETPGSAELQHPDVMRSRSSVQPIRNPDS